MTSEEELKPCPFCGNDDISLDDDGNWFVYCMSFDCASIECVDKERAIEAWNRRV